MVPGIQIAAFDIETTGKNPEFKCGSIFSDSLAEYYDDPQIMLSAMRALARKRYTFIAHNAEYDSTILFWKQGEDYEVKYLNNTYSCGYWRYGPGKRRAPVWDSFRLGAGLPLTDLGEGIGIERYETPKKLLDPNDIRQDWVCSVHDRPGCIECYNLRDAEIVWAYINMMREWLDRYGLSLRKSLPSIAMALWQLWDPGQQQNLQSRTIRDFARKALHGGRCEAFRLGSCGMVSTIDRRAHYGHILAQASLPDLSTLTYRENPNPTHIDYSGEGIIAATVEIDSQFAPPLPIVDGNRTYFPVGVCKGYWPLAEIRHALDYGVRVHRVSHIAASKSVVRPFATTAPALLELREEYRRTGDPRELIPKFLINSIVGRLGLREDHEIVSFQRYNASTPREAFQNSEIESSGGALYITKRHNFYRPSSTGNVLWAACICGTGRETLYDKMVEAGDRLVYVDTDSVHSTQALPAGIDAPGQWINTGVWDTSYYVGPKLYHLETYLGAQQVRAKGIPRDKALEFLHAGETVYQSPQHVIEAIARNSHPAMWVDVTRTMGTGLGGRVCLDDQAMRSGVGYSLTKPHIFLVSDSGHEVY